MISFKPLVGISQNLQHRCSWGQRLDFEVKRSNFKVTVTPNMGQKSTLEFWGHRQPFRQRHIGWWFTFNCRGSSS